MVVLDGTHLVNEKQTEDSKDHQGNYLKWISPFKTFPEIGDINILQARAEQLIQSRNWLPNLTPEAFNMAVITGSIPHDLLKFVRNDWLPWMDTFNPVMEGDILTPDLHLHSYAFPCTLGIFTANHLIGSGRLNLVGFPDSVEGKKPNMITEAGRFVVKETPDSEYTHLGATSIGTILTSEAEELYKRTQKITLSWERVAGFLDERLGAYVALIATDLLVHNSPEDIAKVICYVEAGGAADKLLRSLTQEDIIKYSSELGVDLDTLPIDYDSIVHTTNVEYDPNSGIIHSTAPAQVSILRIDVDNTRRVMSIAEKFPKSHPISDLHRSIQLARKAIKRAVVK